MAFQRKAPGEEPLRPVLSGNHQQVLQETVKNFLTKVCRMILPHNDSLTINGTIGVTVDSGPVVLVHLDECVRKSGGGASLPLDSHRRLSSMMPPFKEESASPSPDELESTSISHSFAMEEDMQGTHRGIVIDREADEEDRAADVKIEPLVIQPIELDDAEAHSRSPSHHRKTNRRKPDSGPGQQEEEGSNPDDDAQAYTSSDYVRIPARMRHKSASPPDALRSLLNPASQCPPRLGRKHRKAMKIPRRIGVLYPAAVVSSSDEESCLPTKPKKSSGKASSPSKHKGLLLGMLLSNNASSESRAMDLATPESIRPAAPVTKEDNDQSALRQLLCDSDQKTALNLCMRPGDQRPSSAEEVAALDDSQLRQLLSRPKDG